MQFAKFGVQFRNFPSQFNGKILDRMIDVAVRSEKLGFDSLWMVDHLEMRPPMSYESQPIPECWTAISALACTTKKMRIGSLVTCSLFRNPAYLAAICNTLNEVSGDRLIVGLGSGWFEQEFRAYGIPYPSPLDRIRATKTALTILREKRTRSAFPVWVGGSGEKSTLKLVAKGADGCSLFGDHETIRRKLEILEKYCSSFNRQFRDVTKSKHSNVVIGVNNTEVASKLRKIIPDESKWSNFILSNIVGTPDQCVVQVEKYLKAGINYLTLTFPDLFETNCLDIFSNEVIEEITRFSS
jgi:alkanesulfonate monooxygenase SsuD/methylene tetrahydromethanopterin reductase-like flavin-dependent oxidoreductase (luciferase family)